MLGLFLIYHVGKQFFNLAELHGKNTWGYAIWGVISYYLALFAGSILVSLIWMYRSPDFEITSNSEYLVGLAGIPFGILACWANYRYLKNKWTYVGVDTDSDLLDQGL